MPPTQMKIANYILKNPQKVIMISICQLAMEGGAKIESSVVKFYRNLGFSGYHDFKFSLATEIAGKSFYYSYEDIAEDDDINDRLIKTRISLFITGKRSSNNNQSAFGEVAWLN
jgi:DNA-binding MurR/RpiR family transcriptional regulator